jgi:osmotically-inducible protein OsmY
MKSNERLQRKVEEALQKDPLLHASSSAFRMEIGISANNGVITLTGHVDSYQKKRAVELAAKSVHGVRALAEEIEVHFVRENHQTDSQIAEAAVIALRECDCVPHDRITISVENGWVKLEGEVEWQFQKDEAEREVEALEGVSMVTNLIRLNPITARSESRLLEITENVQQRLQQSFLPTWEEQHQYYGSTL